jgi:metal-responsive CopG/Arc/MetJ family transcriptional regulator
VQHTFEVQEDALAMLDDAVKKHGLDSRDKALRALLDYCAEDGDWDEIFETVRCRRC